MDYNFDSSGFENDLIDFEKLNILPLKKKSNKYYDKEYDDVTINIYRKMRESCTDPISGDICNEKDSFIVDYMWDSITGEKINKKDPHGPLYFNSISLLKYFYIKRLDHLWCDENDEGENGGYYQGYYGTGVGAGENFHIISRGSYPEYYLWRLPIIDCYLNKDHKKSIPTKGPKLSKDDIITLYTICSKINKKKWSDEFKSLPNIVLIYDLYQIAISQNPLKIFGFNYLKSLLNISLYDTNDIINRQAIEKLKIL